LSLLEAVVLGIVQGLTEFLPISSSGHLVLGEFLLKIKLDDVSFEVFVHLGTFFSVVIVFRNAIRSLLQTVWLLIASRKSARSSDQVKKDVSLLWLIVIGSIPAGIAGLLFKSQIEKSFTSPGLVAVMLLITGVVLFLTTYFKASRDRMNLPDALAVGIAQAFAMLPGISRSGMTISAGIFRGVERSRAAEFSFLLSLPAILGAALIELREVLSHPLLQQNLAIYSAGAITAFGVGYAAIRFLLKVIKKGKFQYFAYYCFALGILFLVFSR
jgi:undecaprenyl-diphosphatase